MFKKIQTLNLLTKIHPKKIQIRIKVKIQQKFIKTENKKNSNILMKMKFNKVIKFTFSLALLGRMTVGEAVSIGLASFVFCCCVSSMESPASDVGIAVDV